MSTPTQGQSGSATAAGLSAESEPPVGGEDRVSTQPTGSPAQPNPERRTVSTEPGAIEVNILDRSYRIACKPEEEAGLLQAVDYLDGKMRELRDSGKALGNERIA